MGCGQPTITLPPPCRSTGGAICRALPRVARAARGRSGEGSPTALARLHPRTPHPRWRFRELHGAVSRAAVARKTTTPRVSRRLARTASECTPADARARPRRRRCSPAQAADRAAPLPERRARGAPFAIVGLAGARRGCRPAGDGEATLTMLKSRRARRPRASSGRAHDGTALRVARRHRLDTPQSSTITPAPVSNRRWQPS